MPMAGSNSTSQNVGANNNSANTPQNNNNATVGSSKTWELSDYELHRTPQEAVTDGTEIAVSPRALHSELMCPICLDMLHSTMTTKECLHRFCSECIVTALRSGNKECPTCRKKLVSKRSLRPDPNFDMLISKIYPSRDEYDQQQQKALAKLSKSHNQLALATSIEEGMKAQSQNRKVQKVGGKGTGQNSGNEGHDGVDSGLAVTPGPQTNGQGHSTTPVNRAASNATVPSSSALLGNSSNSANPAGYGGIGGLPGPSLAKSSRTDSAGGDNSSNTSGFSEEVTEVELVFKPHPDIIVSGNPSAPQNQTRFIKTTANASVEHLAKYLGMRLALDSQLEAASTANLHNCTMYICNSGTDFSLIPANYTLAQVCEKYWRFNKPLEMYFSWRKA